jgi:hypothetical protein
MGAPFCGSYVVGLRGNGRSLIGGGCYHAGAIEACRRALHPLLNLVVLVGKLRGRRSLIPAQGSNVVRTLGIQT